jgi:hypothetical protein
MLKYFVRGIRGSASTSLPPCIVKLGEVIEAFGTTYKTGNPIAIAIAFKKRIFHFLFVILHLSLEEEEPIEFFLNVKCNITNEKMKNEKFFS